MIHSTPKIGWLTLLAFAWLAFSAARPASAADELELQILKAAPEILKTLKEKGVKNVGTLKFRVKNGAAPATDRAGSLNQRLADKLEMALILKNRVQDPIGIVRKASGVAATIPGANHLTPEGRQKLFTKEYPLAWGGTQVVPDAFLTGVAAIAPDFKTMVVAVALFDRTDAPLTNVAQFTLKPDLEDLLELGESFTVRGVFDQSKIVSTNETERKEQATTEAITTTLEIKTETAEVKKPTRSAVHTLSPANTSAAVLLEVRYDGVLVPMEFREGAAFIPEPREGQKVSLRIRRNADQTNRLGVVLKLNGENTLYREKLEDPQCVPWVMAPEMKEFEIRGFQMSVGTAQEFRVLSQAESKGREIDYGEHVGTISVTVFRELTATPKPSPILATDEGEDFAILNKSTLPKETPANLGALKAQLAQSSTRGLIVDGATVTSKIDTVQFKVDPVPIMSGVVRYYNAQDLPK